MSDAWFPVARAEEVVPRHVVHAQLLEAEIALWRDDDGGVNAWENRCPHRGVRLTIGSNEGGELKCRYHGWRFASGDGRCTFIPAHPERTPARGIAVARYGCAERYGYVWVARNPAPPVPPHHAALASAAVTTLRSVAIRAPQAIVHEALDDDGAVFLLQPVSADVTVVHAALLDAPPRERAALLRRWNARLTALRDRLEQRARFAPA